MKGNKNSKAKLKKIERKLQEQKMNAGWEKVWRRRPFIPYLILIYVVGLLQVNAANRQEDPLAALPSFTQFSRGGVEVQLQCTRVTDLNQQTKDWIGEWHNITADSRALPLSSASSTIV